MPYFAIVVIQHLHNIHNDSRVTRCCLFRNYARFFWYRYILKICYQCYRCRGRSDSRHRRVEMIPVGCVTNLQALWQPGDAVLWFTSDVTPAKHGRSDGCWRVKPSPLHLASLAAFVVFELPTPATTPINCLILYYISTACLCANVHYLRTYKDKNLDCNYIIDCNRLVWRICWCFISLVFAFPRQNPRIWHVFLDRYLLPLSPQKNRCQFIGP